MANETPSDPDGPFQCPECNRWSDRGDGAKYIQIANPDPHGSDAYIACLAPDCAAFLFKPDSSRAFGLLAAENIDRPLTQVKKEKLSEHARIDWPY